MRQRRVRRIRSLGRFIRAARQRDGLTQEQLCRLAEVGRTWLSRVENGNQPNPEMAYVMRVLEVLDAEFVVRPRRRFDRKELVKSVKRLFSA